MTEQDQEKPDAAPLAGIFLNYDPDPDPKPPKRCSVLCEGKRNPIDVTHDRVTRRKEWTTIDGDAAVDAPFHEKES